MSDERRSGASLQGAKPILVDRRGNLKVCPIAVGILLLGPWGNLQFGVEPSAADLLSRAAAAARRGDKASAVQLATQVIQRDPRHASAYYLRGREQFRLGKVHASVEDFEKYVKWKPEVESRLWERGISYYYDGQFTKGAKQFELYQTYHDNDVENSVWRYLCVARTDGVSKARETMLPIENDRRVPMMQIYALFRGQLQPHEVLSAVDVGNPDDGERIRRSFYAHLYLGLFFEVHGDGEAAKRHIVIAADQFRIEHYMWDVAHVHAQRLRHDDQANSSSN